MQGLSHARFLATCRLGEGKCRLMHPLGANSCLLGAHPAASGLLRSPFLAVLWDMSLRTLGTVNWRHSSQTNTRQACDLAQSWHRAQHQGEA